MENLNKYGRMVLRGGHRADEIIKLLIDNGFMVSYEGGYGNSAEYEIFKLKDNQTQI